ncbi:MAG: Cys-tRNA(Pro) deacylase [Clostridiales bacterium]|nr:Cys-tRNA(Pro) deacylase [Clostridiales bacterium]
MAEAKTNAMRIVEKAKVNFSVLSYEVGDSLDGVTAAEKLGRGVEEVYKTLIARGAKKEIYVFIIPVAEELNLKLAARSVGEKNMEMVRLDELLGLTGYIRGGCSPIGMKKRYRTVIDSSAQSRNTVIVSAGKRGLQLEMDPRDLANLTGASFDKIIFDK